MWSELIGEDAHETVHVEFARFVVRLEVKPIREEILEQRSSHSRLTGAPGAIFVLISKRSVAAHDGASTI